MKDLRAEEPLVLLKDVLRLLVVPQKRGSKRMRQRSSFRRAFRGGCGVRLETTSVGGQRYMSVPALLRCFASVMEAERVANTDSANVNTRKTKTPQHDVERELELMGL